jgi:hypothetical protein
MGYELRSDKKLKSPDMLLSENALKYKRLFFWRRYLSLLNLAKENLAALAWFGYKNCLLRLT